MPPTVTAEALHQALLASDSATAVLEAICGGTVSIRRSPDGPWQPPIRLSGGLHRRVALLCGARHLSDADLWFRPELLPPDMVAALAQSDAPFGRVVHALGLRRRTLYARVCAPGEPFAVEHRAVLSRAAGEDIAEVAERYCWGLVESRAGPPTQPLAPGTGAPA